MASCALCANFAGGDFLRGRPHRRHLGPHHRLLRQRRHGHSNLLGRGRPRRPLGCRSSRRHPRHPPRNLQSGHIGRRHRPRPALRPGENHNKRVQTIKLALSPLSAYIPLTVSGWGKTADASETHSDLLKWASMTSMAREECEPAYPGTVIGDGMVCVEGTFGWESTCDGDSGAPLTIADGRLAVHVAMVSFGSSLGCETGAPIVATRTVYYSEWIRRNAGL